MGLTNVYNLAQVAVYTGVSAFKGCLEHLGQSLEEIEILSDIAQKTGVLFGVKIGGPTADTDASNAADIGADFIVAPCVESKYTASQAAGIADSHCVNFDMMIETVTALSNPEIWSVAAKRADTVIFGLSDIKASGGRSIQNAYDYFVDRKVDIAIGGGITPEKALELAEEYSWTRYIETRHCRIDTGLTDDLRNSVANALRFEIAYYDYIGRSGSAAIIASRLSDDCI